MTSLELEQAMEAKNLPESDRDEVRAFTDFLQWRKDKRDGKEVPPLTAEQRARLTGEEQPQ
jgi:hypothetical protein